MKKIISLIILSVFILMGCATNGSYQRYLDAKQNQVNAERKPLIDLALTEDGRIASIKMYPQPQHIRIEQENPHPAWGTIETAARVFAPVGMVWASFDGAANLVQAGNGSTNNINSGNNQSENAGSINSTTDYLTNETVDTAVDTNLGTSE